ncbi:hypothetical protein [Streptomyces sp. NPDC005799]|uniref:hypothetical protein n=1 Tax=Streptomyces sp. NPDC005799 TaxID=3154678 RepID=UPI0033D4F9E6
MDTLLQWMLYVVTEPIRAAVALLLILLACFVFSLPALLGKGIGALERGVVTLLVPSRRAARQSQRSDERARKQWMRDEMALLQREIAEYGKEEASRRQRERFNVRF